MTDAAPSTPGSPRAPYSAPATLPGWRHVYSGKVRDLYEPDDAGGDDRMLVVASDRVSAFDHLLEPGIPGKGALLTELSRWWFAQLGGIPNHLVDDAPPADIADRAMVVRRLEMFPIECVVRGYLTGTGWLEYQREQSVCGVPLPSGLRDGDQLPHPIYTPAHKAPLGDHDENISFDRTVELVGAEAAEALRDRSLEIFGQAAAISAARGVILVDTKFEFGTDPGTGEISLGDEVLTSDSSRYWDAEGGRGASFDKQIIRDWLAENWDRAGTPPMLPAEIVQRTATRYRELLDRLTA